MQYNIYCKIIHQNSPNTKEHNEDTQETRSLLVCNRGTSVLWEWLRITEEVKCMW